ncbi:hypothetical protein MMC18_006009 [Xylographa bjoerkii]|nr:hypothetical protein [Xylographa bjoerkii]
MLFLGALLVTLFFPISTSADQIAITDLPLFTRADFDVKYCVSAEQLDWISTFGCAVTNPAACLCSDSSTSYRVASAISDCVDGEIGWSDGRSDLITATGIFASYCLTNAGISAHDETLLEDFSIYTEGPAQIANCARSVSSAYSTSLGCDFYTPAACLCGQSSFVIQSAMLSCASEDVIYSPQFVASTITELWSSYCSVNLAHPATRQDEPIITDIGSGPTGGAPSSAAPSATASTPMSKTDPRLLSIFMLIVTSQTLLQALKADPPPPPPTPPHQVPAAPVPAAPALAAPVPPTQV